MGPRSLNRGDVLDLSVVMNRTMLRFNGAAVSQPRRRCSSSTTAATASLLQWGRGLSTAETAFSSARLTSISVASMGPRSLNRGDSRHSNYLVVKELEQRLRALVCRWGLQCLHL